MSFWAAMILAIAAVGLPLAAQEKQDFSPEDIEFFEKKIRPILVERCFECHGPDVEEPSGDLQMVSRDALLEGGGTGPAIELGNPAKSLFVEAIHYTGIYEMPPDSKLPDEEIAVLTEWVERGAPWPASNEAARIGPKEFNLEKRRSEHWCWQPITRPALPTVQHPSWVRQPLDAYILAGLEANSLSPAPEADRATLVRRVYLDLIGLPPTTAELDAFLADESADAYERLVDRLLASPRFGEHWARRWMDLVRYAETCGHEYDYPLPYAHEYRDYLIRAFNADVPYDQFAREHLAGDLLPEPRRNPDNQIDESIIATGFWFLGEATHGPVDVRGDEAGRIDNQIDVVGKTFLGLTVACARCHDHMFDAISTKDYYGLVGFLQSSRRQLALLDPDRKIESAATQLREQQRELDGELSAYRQALTERSETELANYLAASLECLAAVGKISLPQSQKLQGEQFGAVHPSGGTVEVQELTPTRSHAWEGNKHLWWQGGKVGDRLSLEFQIDAEGVYDLVANFTKANDYGIVRISLDDAVVIESLDLFANDVITSGPQTLVQKRLSPGHHALHVELIGSNPDAAPKHMFGLDYFEFQARPDEFLQQLSAAVTKVAAERSLDARLVREWIEALLDKQINDPQHPLYLLQQVIQTGGLTDSAARSKTLQEVAQRREAADQILAESPVVCDFNSPELPGWYKTGWAFDDVDVPAWSVDASGDGTRTIGRSGTVSSGRYGAPLYGVLRSPTFLLENKFVHYRVSGRDVDVRVIIDGFTLDIYNSLLFNGITLKIDSPNRFVWLAQGQDVQNYRGHRVHLEIVDHSGGAVSLDEIRVSDHPNLPDVPTRFLEDSLSQWTPATAALQSSDFDALAQQLAPQIRSAISSDAPTADGSELLEWVYRWNLSHDEDVLRSRQVVHDAVASRREWLVANRIPTPIFAQAITDGTGENEFVFVRGNHRTLGPEAPRKMIEAIPTPSDRPWSTQTGSGRRLLADAIASPDNPLTARVMVNRLWHHVFGQGVVASVDNFGVLGERPSHPELLDALATQFIDEGWSVKKMLRSLVTSSTYRLSSEMNAAAEQADPDNRLLHRASVRRLSAEAIRDSILQVSGKLDTTMYGPSIPIYLTPFMQGRGRPDKSGPLDGARRRSVYIEVRRNFLNPMMLTFDAPSPFSAVGRRTVSNVPSQALLLLNHPFVLEQSQLWAERVMAEAESEKDRVQRLFREAYAREATDDDAATAQRFLVAQRENLAASGVAAAEIEPLAWRDLCHVLINAKEFYYVH